jgi:hypothetical protein
VSMQQSDVCAGEVVDPTNVSEIEVFLSHHNMPPPFGFITNPFPSEKVEFLLLRVWRGVAFIQPN